MFGCVHTGIDTVREGERIITFDVGDISGDKAFEKTFSDFITIFSDSKFAIISEYFGGSKDGTSIIFSEDIDDADDFLWGVVHWCGRHEKNFHFFDVMEENVQGIRDLFVVTFEVGGIVAKIMSFVKYDKAVFESFNEFIANLPDCFMREFFGLKCV